MDYTIAVEPRAEQATALVAGHVAHDGIPEFLGGAYTELMARGARVGHHRPAVRPLRHRRRRLLDRGGVPGRRTGRGHADGSYPVDCPPAWWPRPLHVGSYSDLGAAYSALETWLEDTGHTRAGRPWECYLDGPEVAEPRTVVCWPVAAL